MGNPTYLSISSVGVTTGINVDYRQSPFNMSVLFTGSSSGTFGYTVEYSLDDPQWLAVITSTRSPVWLPDPNLTAASCNKISVYDFPVAAVRLNSTALSSAMLTMTVLQSGSG